MKKLFLAFIVLLAIPLTVGFQIDDITFSWMGEEIDQVGIRVMPPIIADMKITMSGEDIDLFEINTRQFNTVSTPITISASACSSASNGYECHIRNIPLFVSQSPSLIEITAHKGMQREQSNYSVNLNLYEAEPELDKVDTHGCEDECFIGPNTDMITLEFTGTTAGFNRGHVYFILGDENKLVDWCEDNTCYSRVRSNFACSHRETLPLTLTNYAGRQTRDDAGNNVLPTTKFLTCDNNPPIIDEILAISTDGFEAVGDEDGFKIRVLAQDDTSNVLFMNATIEGQTQSATCTKGTDGFVCEASFEAMQIGEVTVSVELFDQAMNRAFDTQTITILQSSDEQITLTATSTISNPRMNRQNLGFAREIYATAKINNAQLIDAQLRQCTPRSETTGNSGDLSQTRLLGFEGDEIYFRTTLAQQGSGDRYEGFNVLEYECEARARVIRDNVLYGSQTFTIPIRIELTGQRRLSDYIDAELDAVKERTENRAKVIGTARETINYVERLCGFGRAGSAAMAVTGAGVAAVETAAVATSWVPGVGQGLTAKAISYGNWYEQTGEWLSENLAGFARACEILTCNNDFIFGSGVAEVFDGSSAMQGWASALDYDKPSDALDPWRSEPIAYMTLCVPAIVSHQEKRLTNECNYATCLVETVGGMGADIDVCKRQKAMNECVHITGSAINTFVPAAMFTQSADLVQSVVNDPVQAVGLAWSAVCAVRVPFTKGLCGLEAHGSQAVIFGNQLLNMGDMFSRPYSSSNYCDTAFSYADQSNQFYRNRTIPSLDMQDDFEIEKYQNTYNLGENSDLICTATECTLSRNRNVKLVRVEDNVQEETKIFYEGRFVGTVGELDFITNEEIELTQEITDDFRGQYGFLFRDGEIDSGFVEEVLLAGEKTGENREEIRRIIRERYSDMPATTAYLDYLENPTNPDLIERSKKDIEKYEQEISNLNTQRDKIEGMSNSEFASWLRDNDEAAYDACAGDLGVCPPGQIIIIKEMQKDEFDSQISEAETAKEEAQNIVDTAGERAEELEAAAIDEQADARKDQTWRHFYGDWSAVVRTTQTRSRAINILRGNSATQSARWPSSLGFMNDLSDFLTDISQPEVAMCESVFNQGLAQFDNVASVTTSGTSQRVGAYITGRRSAEINPPNEDAYYLYWINGGLSPRESGLSYRLILTGTQGTQDITEKVFNEPLMTANRGLNQIGGQRMVSIQENFVYEQVCIEFVTSDIRRYFNTNSNRICQVIEVEG